MQLSRRKFIGLAAGGAAATVWPELAAASSLLQSRVKAIAFDAFPIFDPRPVFMLAETIFPGRGAELSGVWQSRQFEYQWLRSMSGHYADFFQATEDALVFAARQLKLGLTTKNRARLMQSYLELRPWPDAISALNTLREMGLRLAFLSNMTRTMLETAIEKTGLMRVFECVLSTDELRIYKPDPRAYALAVRAFGLRKEEILFVAFAGWDLAGAKWFGYRTFWANRFDLPSEELGVSADGVGHDLNDLVGFIKSQGG